MTSQPDLQPFREIVGIFHLADDLQDAVDELLSCGFDRAELSLLAGEHAVREKLGSRYTEVSGLADNPETPRMAYVSDEALGWAEGSLISGLLYVGATVAAGAVLVSGGSLAVAIAAAALSGGTGGLIGSILARWVGHQHAHYLEDQLEKGGLLLWVRVWDVADCERAIRILRKHCGENVRVHTAAVIDSSFEKAIPE